MLENTPTEAFMSLLNEMMHWFKSIEIPNSFSLVVEIAIGVTIAPIVYGLRSKTRTKMTEVINQISSYTEKKREHETTKKKYYNFFF